jgi:hypothetical protein
MIHKYKISLKKFFNLFKGFIMKREASNQGDFLLRYEDAVRARDEANMKVKTLDKEARELACSLAIAKCLPEDGSLPLEDVVFEDRDPSRIFSSTSLVSFRLAGCVVEWTSNYRLVCEGHYFLKDKFDGCRTKSDKERFNGRLAPLCAKVMELDLVHKLTHERALAMRDPIAYLAH